MTPKKAPGDEYWNPLGNMPTSIGEPTYGPGQEQFFAEALGILDAAGVPVLIAGAFASHAYTGIWRNTKDLDVFLRPDHVHTALRALSDAGFETELRDATWIGKAWKSPYLVDLIFGMGSRVFQVDESWIERGRPAQVAGVQARLIAPEDLLASKMYIAKRDRFDGADIVHLIRCLGREIDWERLLERMDPDRLLVLWHVVLFVAVYPGLARVVPAELVDRLTEELRRHWKEPPGERTFRGTLLDDLAFAIDVEYWGYEDPRPPESEVAVIVEGGGHAS